MIMKHALYHFGTAHGECNVHIIRYLRKNTEEAKHKWSSEMRYAMYQNDKASPLTDLNLLLFLPFLSPLLYLF